MFGDLCKNKTPFLCIFVDNSFLVFAPVDVLRTPEPVPCTKLLSYTCNRQCAIIAVCGTAELNKRERRHV